MRTIEKQYFQTLTIFWQSKHLSIEPCQRHIFKWCIFYILAICKYGRLGLGFWRLLSCWMIFRSPVITCPDGLYWKGEWEQSQKVMLNGIICFINILDFQLLVQSVSITTKVVSSNPDTIQQKVHCSTKELPIHLTKILSAVKEGQQKYCETLKIFWITLNQDLVCLYNYEFGLSLCKIVRSSVILLLPLLWSLGIQYK
jgi:hypothetical protein